MGRKTAVPVYELTGFATDAAPAAWDTFATGLARFSEGKFAEAGPIFEQLPDDPAARSYAQPLHGAIRPSAGHVGWGMGADGEMSLRLFIGGMRGSRPVTGAAFEEFGGDTTSLLLVGSHGERLVLDAGTGMHAVAEQLAEAGPGEVTVFFSHYHLDHMAGLTMNPLFYQSGWSFRLRGADLCRGGVRDAVTRLLAPPYWPVAGGANERTVRICRVSPRKQLHVRPTCACEAVPCRIRAGAWLTASTTRPAAPRSCSPPISNGRSERTRTRRLSWHFVASRDRLTCSSLTRILPGRCEAFAGWGHSSWEDDLEIAQSAGVQRVLLGHHAPDADDKALRALEQQVKKRSPGSHARTGRTMVDDR